MIKYLIYTIFVVFSLSCSNNNNDVEIINDKLAEEIKNLVNIVKNNPPCKYDYLTVRINKEKIYISNSMPINSKVYIGKCNVDDSEVFFYTYADYDKYILVNDNYMKKINIDPNYNNRCHPDMDLILLIDKDDPSKLTRFIPII